MKTGDLVKHRHTGKIGVIADPPIQVGVGSLTVWLLTGKIERWWHLSCESLILLSKKS